MIFVETTDERKIFLLTMEKSLGILIPEQRIMLCEKAEKRRSSRKKAHREEPAGERSAHHLL